jgi:hypothetical protein
MNGTNAVTPNDLPNLLDQFRRERFYGRLSFDLREGEVTLIRTERTQIVNTKHQGVNRDGNSPEPVRK